MLKNAYRPFFSKPPPLPKHNPLKIKSKAVLSTAADTRAPNTLIYTLCAKYLRINFQKRERDSKSKTGSVFCNINKEEKIWKCTDQEIEKV